MQEREVREVRLGVLYGILIAAIFLAGAAFGYHEAIAQSALKTQEPPHADR